MSTHSVPQPDPPRKTPDTVAQVIEAYRAHAKLEKRRSHSFDSQLNKVSAALGQYPVASLTYELLTDWCRALLERYSRDYVSTLINYLRAALHHVHRIHPTLSIPSLPNIGNRRQRTGRFDPGEYEGIRPHIFSAPVRDVLDFLAASGWRLGEALGLTWADVDVEREVILLRDSKTGAPGVIGILGAIRTVLERRLAAKNGLPWVFHRNGEAINPRRVTEGLRQACKEAKVPIRTPHDLRRTAAQDLLAAGVDVPTAMALTRHRDVRVFLRHYAQANLSRITEAQAALERFRAKFHQERPPSGASETGGAHASGE